MHGARRADFNLKNRLGPAASATTFPFLMPKRYMRRFAKNAANWIFDNPGAVMGGVTGSVGALGYTGYTVYNDQLKHQREQQQLELTKQRLDLDKQCHEENLALAHRRLDLQEKNLNDKGASQPISYHYVIPDVPSAGQDNPAGTLSGLSKDPSNLSKVGSTTPLGEMPLDPSKSNQAIGTNSVGNIDSFPKGKTSFVSDAPASHWLVHWLIKCLSWFF
ncbi:unnamed protein product [Sphagnum tenellum]